MVKPLLSGTDLARQADPAAALHADVIDAFKDQLLISFLKRLGGSVDIPVVEVDDTGRYLLSFNITDGAFHFKLTEKS